MGRWRENLVAAGISLLAAVVLTWPLATHVGTRLPHDPRFTDPAGSDIHIARWNFWWARTALERGQDPFQCDLVFHPEGHSLALHDHTMLWGVLSVPLQWFGGSDAAVSLMLLLVSAAAGGATFALARRLSLSRTSALGAALAWSLSPYFLQKGLEHLALAASPWPPLWVLALLTWAGAEQPRARRRAALAAGLVLGAALMTALQSIPYLVGLGALLVAVAAPVKTGEPPATGAAEQPSSARRGLADPLAWCAALGGLALVAWPWLAAMVRDGAALLASAQREQLYHPRFADFFTPSGLHPAFQGLGAAGPGAAGPGVNGVWVDGGWSGPRNENAALTLRFGLILLAAAGCVFERRARRWVAVALVLLLVAWDPGPQPVGWVSGVLRRLPLLDSLRVPARALPFALLPLVLAAGLGWDALWRRGRSGRGAALVLALLLVFESWVGPYPTLSAAVPDPVRALARWDAAAGVPDGARAGGRAVLTLPFAGGASETLGWQTVHGYPVTTTFLARTDPRRLAALLERAPALWALVSQPEPETPHDPVRLGAELDALDVGHVLFSRESVLEPERFTDVLDGVPGWVRVETPGATGGQSGTLWWVREADAARARLWLDAVGRTPGPPDPSSGPHSAE